MTEACLYIPASDKTIKGKAQKVFRTFAYSIWRREVRRFRKRHQASPFTIADIGCGPGFLLTCLRSWFPDADLVGVDSDPRLLAIAKERCRSIRTIQADATFTKLESQSVNVLFALHIVEHLERPQDFFLEACRVLRPGGLLVIATPNADGLAARLLKNKWSGYSDPTHIALNGPKFWRSLMLDSGFEIRNDGTTGLSGLPLLNRMPLGLLHWIPTFFFGFYPWSHGEAYICTAIARS